MKILSCWIKQWQKSRVIHQDLERGQQEVPGGTLSVSKRCKMTRRSHADNSWRLTANLPPLLKVWGGQMRLSDTERNRELHFHAFSSIQIPFQDNTQCDFVGVLLVIISTSFSILSPVPRWGGLYLIILQWSFTNSDFQPFLAWSSPNFSSMKYETAIYPMKSPSVWCATPPLPFSFQVEWHGLQGPSWPSRAMALPSLPTRLQGSLPFLCVRHPPPRPSQPDSAQARLTHHFSWKSSPSQAPFPGRDVSLLVETYFTVSILITPLVTLSCSYIYLLLLHQTEFLENRNAAWHACLLCG